MSEPFVGQIIAVGFNFAPVGWALCDGRTLAISEYEVLYTLIGTVYGGNGTTTFNLPDLRGRGIVNSGQAPGQQNYLLAQAAGAESVTLTAGQLGAHTHVLEAAATATQAGPGEGTVFGTPANEAIYGTTGTATTLAPSSVGVFPAGAANQGHENRQPFTTINYIVALYGIYPTQS